MTQEEKIIARIQQKISDFEKGIKRVIPDKWKLESYSTVWYRGESAEYEESRTSIARAIESSKYCKTSEDFHKNYYTYRMWLYEKTKSFLKDNYEDVYTKFNSSFNYPYFMQHYGIPTDFLDFTPELDTALYFAIANCKDGNSAVLWLFAPTLFNYSNVLNYQSEDIKAEDSDAYHIGAAEDKNFYDAMIYGRNEDGTARITCIEDFDNYAYEMTPGFSKAISPISNLDTAHPLIERMYKQSGFFLYSVPIHRGLDEITRASIVITLNRKLNLPRNREIANVLLQKIVIQPNEVQILKSYLDSKGLTKQKFGLDDLGKNYGIFASQFTYDAYIEETGGVRKSKTEEEFVKEHIRKMYTPVYK